MVTQLCLWSPEHEDVLDVRSDKSFALRCPCGRLATWEYELQGDRVACDACVPRNCGCQTTPEFDLLTLEAQEQGFDEPTFIPALHVRCDAAGHPLVCIDWMDRRAEWVYAGVSVSTPSDSPQLLLAWWAQ